MSDPRSGRALVRPRQATIGGVLAAAACVLLVVTLFDSMSQIRSADTQSTIRDFLSRPPGDSIGLTVEGAITMLRLLVLASGALAATGAVLAIYALRRHRGARIGLSVVAGLMLFTTSFVAGLMPVLVAVATTMLWGRDSRAWFSGRQPEPAAAGRASGQSSDRSGDRSGDQPAVWPTQPPADQPAVWPTQPPADQPGAAAGGWPPPADPRVPPPAARPFGQSGAWPSPGGPPVATRLTRPSSVARAAVLTWVFSGLAGLFFLLLALTLVADSQDLVATIQTNPQVAAAGITDRAILGTLWVLAAVGLFWTLSTVALAVLAFHRVNAARVLLVISAGLAAVPCLIVVPFGWPNAAAGIAVVVLLLRRSASDWYAGRPASGDGQSWPPQGPPQQEWPQQGPSQQGPPQQEWPPPGQPPQQGPPPSGKPPVW